MLKDSPINKLEDLKGKNVGAPSFGAGGGLGLKQNLSAIGITPEQYTAIATGAGPSAIAALKGGKIDALVMWDAMLGAGSIILFPPSLFPADRRGGPAAPQSEG